MKRYAKELFEGRHPILLIENRTFPIGFTMDPSVPRTQSDHHRIWIFGTLNWSRSYVGSLNRVQFIESHLAGRSYLLTPILDVRRFTGWRTALRLVETLSAGADAAVVDLRLMCGSRSSWTPIRP